MNWLRGMVGLDRDGAQTKDISTLSGYSGDLSFANRDNLERNQVTIQSFMDEPSQGSAIGLTATWACVNFWAGNIAALSLSVFREGPDGVAVEDKRHPLHELLRSPNYDDSPFDFWEFMVASLELSGNAYAFIDRRADGTLYSLQPMRPDRVSVRRLDNGSIEYRWTDNKREQRILQDRDVLHIRGPMGDALGGRSPLVVLRNVFVSAVATESASAAMFRHGIKTSGVLTKDGEPLTPDQRTRLEGLLQERFVGAANAGRPMLLDGGLSWTQIAINPVDAQMLESRYLGIEEICRAFEVDPHLVGHIHGNTLLGSSMTEQTNSVMKFKMRKRLKRIEGALEKQLLTRADRQSGVSIKFNVESFLRADSAGRAAFYDIMKQFMTKNEIRALEGLAPVDGGDVLMAQMQDVPLSAALGNTGTKV